MKKDKKKDKTKFIYDDGDYYCDDYYYDEFGGC